MNSKQQKLLDKARELKQKLYPAKRGNGKETSGSSNGEISIAVKTEEKGIVNSIEVNKEEGNLASVLESLSG